MLKIFIFAALVALSSLTYAQNNGRFIGKVHVEWLPDGRRMQLLAPFAYVDPSGRRWEAPRGSKIDGASIPRIAWSAIGGPFEGRFREASVIHDVACVEKTRSHEIAHEAFYYAMLAGGTDLVQAKLMYAAVYKFAPSWEVVVDTPISAATAVMSRVLAAAPAGSTASVQARAAKSITSPAYASPSDGSSQKTDLVVTVTPPQTAAASEAFERIKIEIESRERAKPGSVSLADIRAL